MRLQRTVDSYLPLSKSTGSLPSARAVRRCQRARHQGKGRDQRTFWKRSFQQLPHDRMLIRKDQRPTFDKDSLLDSPPSISMEQERVRKTGYDADRFRSRNPGPLEPGPLLGGGREGRLARVIEQPRRPGAAPAL